MTEPLHTRYRPNALDQVIGQDAVVRALTKSIEDGSSHAYLFCGPSGCGKTTLARIVASAVGCQPQDIFEVDAALKTGVDDMRLVTEGMRYKPMGAGSARALVLNEVQRLSPQAFDSLLMSVEEPAPHAYWFFTTTDPRKIPAAMMTRCTRFEIKAVPWQMLLNELLVPLADVEGLKIGNDILGLCAREAQGSPRQALVNLTTCSAATDMREAADLLRSAEVSGAPIELARALFKKQDWPSLMKIVNGLEDESPESVRHVVRAYATKVATGADSAGKAQRALAILDVFDAPFNPADGVSPLVLALGRLILLRLNERM